MKQVSTNSLVSFFSLHWFPEYERQTNLKFDYLPDKIDENATVLVQININMSPTCCIQF